jgi:putative membrane protein
MESSSKMKLAIAGLSTSLALAGAVGAQGAAEPNPVADPKPAETGKPSSSRSRALNAHDRNFAKTAADAGNAEVTMGQLAKNRARSPDVRAFAARMVDDHQKAGQQLHALAARNGITLPSQLSTKDRSELDKLSRLQGEAFDAEYVKVQLAAHQEAVSLFTAEAESGSDMELKQFASSTRPTLADHLRMVEHLADGGKNVSLGMSSDVGRM